VKATDEFDQRLGSESFRALDAVKAEQDIDIVPFSLGGYSGPRIYSAEQLGTSVVQGKSRLVAVENSFQNGLAQLGSKILLVVEKTGETVFNCKPSDINGFYEVEVERDTMTPEERKDRFQIGLSLRGELSWDTRAREFYNIEKPQEEFVKLQSERLIQSGQMDDIIMQSVSQFLGVAQVAQAVKDKLKGGAIQGTQGPQPVPSEFDEITQKNPQSQPLGSQEPIPRY
jgi:hypothetical protein